MDDRFRSRRDELDRARRGLQLATDICTLSQMASLDIARVAARTEDLVQDEESHQALARHSGRLGILMQDLNSLAPSSSRASLVQEKFCDEWAAFICNQKALPRPVVQKVQNAAQTFSDVIAKLSVIEDNGDSSSYGDYSDSDTESDSMTKSTESSEGSDDGDESDESDESDDGGDGGRSCNKKRLRA